MAGRRDLRLVFDAAAKPHGRCLNDFVTSGSAFQDPLPAVLIHFGGSPGPRIRKGYGKDAIQNIDEITCIPLS